MKWTGRLSIYYKINIIFVSVLLLLSLIISMIMIETTGKLLDQQIEKRGSEVASYIAALSSNDILLDDYYLLFDRINRIKDTTEDVRYILVTNSFGRIIAHTFSGNLPEGLPLMAPSIKTINQSEAFSFGDNDQPNGLSYQVGRFNSNEGAIREITVPIESGIGFVRVGMSERSTQQLLRKKMGDFFIITLLSCMLAMLASAYLAHVIIKPIRTLAQAAKEIHRGNLSVQTKKLAEDEIGHLTGLFNEMANGLKQKEMENNRLLAELRDKEAIRTFLINKMFSIQEEERQRLSRELHDETGQSLVSILAYMKVLQSKLTSDTQRNLLQEGRNLVINVLEGLRKTAVELRPPVLDDLGIVAAMTKYIQGFSIGKNIAVKFSPPESKLFLSNETALALYRILQESLTNIAKHAKATSVWITLSTLNHSVTLKIEDNGVGMKSEVLQVAHATNCLGIYGMQERAELVGGTLSMQSSQGEGTTITVTLPI